MRMVRRRFGDGREIALLAFAPALVPPAVHALVLKFDLLPRLAIPIDGGATIRGRRILGANKTWRGAVVLASSAVPASACLFRWDRYRERLPAELRAADPSAVGLLVGAGIVLGELPNSFLKRQLDIGPGEQIGGLPGVALSIYDQVDLVTGVYTCLSPLWRPSPAAAATAVLVVGAVHSLIGVLGQATAIRTSWR